MNYKEFTLSANPHQIYGQYIQPETSKGVIILIHGFGEHLGRYKEHVVPALLEIGLGVVIYDNIGHGKSEGKRGHCPSYKALLDIMAAVINKTHSLFPQGPYFLYGHSMGGNLVLNYILKRTYEFKGIVTTSPYLRLAFKPPKWKLILGKLLLYIAPSMTLPSGLDANGISRIPEEVEKYKQDPLIHNKVSPMFSLPVIDAGNWAISNAPSLELPTLLVHGMADPIIDVKGSQEFHSKASTTTLKLFEGGYHELHNDLCRKEVLLVIQNWLRQQL